MSEPDIRGSAPLDAEETRLQALRSTGLLDSATEKQFDELVQLAASICDAPISLISLVDEHRQWFKARIGLDASETPRDQSFCAHAIQKDGLFVVPDTLKDPRFMLNALVSGAPFIRFYAGCPLSTSKGEKLGTLCIIDQKPRVLSDAQKSSLDVLAKQAMFLIDLRTQLATLEQLVQKSGPASAAYTK